MNSHRIRSDNHHWNIRINLVSYYLTVVDVVLKESQ